MVICPIMVLKVAVTVFTALPFCTLLTNDLIFFGHSKKNREKLILKFVEYWEKLILKFVDSLAILKILFNK